LVSAKDRVKNIFSRSNQELPKRSIGNNPIDELDPRFDSVSTTSDDIVNATDDAQTLLENLPKRLQRKTVATDRQGTNTLSGWANKSDDFVNISPEQVLEHQKLIGKEAKSSGFLDQGVLGKYNASHAEKQLIVAKPNTTIDVSREMCKDCQKFFSLEAIFRNKPQTVIDPIKTRIFRPDGTVEEILK
jgi:filamentous hemagglutinin